MHAPSASLKALALIAVIGGLAAATASGCSSSERQGSGPRQTCEITIWYEASSPSAHVDVRSSWGGWEPPGDALERRDADNWRVRTFDLPPGEHAYAIVEDGTWLTDPRVGTTAFENGREVSLVFVPNCDEPAVQVKNVHFQSGYAIADLVALRARDGSPIDWDTIVVHGADGAPLEARPLARDIDEGTTRLEIAGLGRGKHVLTVQLSDDARRKASALMHVWSEADVRPLSDWAIYQIIVDRYRGDAGALQPPALLSERAGGTLRGITRAIESGEIEAMGFNAIWLSPLYPNPDGLFPGEKDRVYSSYHGYWPIASRGIDPRLGTESDFDVLVHRAHERGIRVIVDVVPNHVHEQNPLVGARWGEGWFNRAEPACVCGEGSCTWDKHIEDCWFAPYLPDLDWRKADVARQMSREVVWWMDRFDVDGLRIDAVPMMPRAATRRIAYETRSRHAHPGHDPLLLGENFTGPGAYELLRYHLGPFGLNSQFHFPLMWALRSAIGTDSAKMTELDAAVRDGEFAWEGSGATMSLMIGNHDVPRFATVAAGEPTDDGWTPAAQPDDPVVYAKQAMALGLVFALPGVPVVYYGDEVALAGRRDPDSRRPLPDESELTPAQTTVRETMRRVAVARQRSVALRRGNYELLHADESTWVFARKSEGETAIVVAVGRANAPNLPAEVAVRLPAGQYVDVVSGVRASLPSELTNLGGGPFSLHVLIPDSGSALPPAGSGP